MTLNHFCRPFISCFLCEILLVQTPIVPYSVVYASVSLLFAWVEADEQDTKREHSVFLKKRFMYLYIYIYIAMMMYGGAYICNSERSSQLAQV